MIGGRIEGQACDLGWMCDLRAVRFLKGAVL